MKEGVPMVEISIKDLKGRFADYCNDLLTYNKSLNENFSIDGTITGNVRKYADAMYFILSDDNKASVNVRVSKEYFEEVPLLTSNNRVNVKGNISLNKAGYLNGFELVQLNAVEVTRISTMSSEYNKSLMYVCKSNKMKRSIDYSNKPYMTVAVITSRDGEGLPDVQYALRGCDYFKLKHIPTNMFKAEEIASNISGADGADIILIVRGGTTNIDIFSDIKILEAVIESKSYTVCGIGHAQQEPLINKVVDVEESTPTSAGMYLKDSYSRHVSELESVKQKETLSKKDRSKTWVIVVLLVMIMVLILKYKFRLF